MQQELTGGWPRASQGLDVMEMDPLGQGHDTNRLGPDHHLLVGQAGKYTQVH